MTKLKTLKDIDQIVHDKMMEYNPPSLNLIDIQQVLRQEAIKRIEKLREEYELNSDEYWRSQDEQPPGWVYNRRVEINAIEAFIMEFFNIKEKELK